jgi:hypothetical protein
VDLVDEQRRPEGLGGSDERLGGGERAEQGYRKYVIFSGLKVKVTKGRPR